VTANRRKKVEYDTRVENKNTDMKNFLITPRIVLYVTRTSQQIALWNAIRDVAGESGVCYTTTENLALIAHMSIEKAIETRRELIDLHLIDGRLSTEHSVRPMWHLTIPDLWKWNDEWNRKYPDWNTRIEYAERNQYQMSGFERVCIRCNRSYITVGRTSFRCEDCQNMKDHEKQMIRNEIRRRTNGASSSEKSMIGEDAVCPHCGRTEKLELHLVSNNEKGTFELEIICAECHDRLHAEDYRALTVVNGFKNPDLNVTSEWHSDLNATQEQPSNPHDAAFNPLNATYSEESNISLSVNKISRNIDTPSTLEGIWKETRFRLRYCGVNRDEVRDRTLSAEPINVVGGIFHLRFKDSKEYEWAVAHLRSFKEAVRGVMEDVEDIALHGEED
jgi:hypothetical protein